MPPATARGGRALRGRDPRRRRAILDAADAVIQREGPDAPMTAIAAEAGISKPILYRHFGDKSGLYRALAERHVDPLMERVREKLREPADLRPRVRATVGTYLRMIGDNLNLYRFLMHRATAEDPRTRGDVGLMVRRFGEEFAETLVAERHIADPVRAQIVAHAVIGMVQAAGEWWLDHPEIAYDDVIEDLTEAVVGAVTGGGAPHAG
ncbi:TetR family transcriptional regulator [Thermobifida alba]